MALNQTLSDDHEVALHMAYATDDKRVQRAFLILAGLISSLMKEDE